MSETIDLKMALDVSDLKKKLSELPKATKKEALKAVRELNKSIKKAEKRAAKLEKAEKGAAREARRLARASAELKGKARAGFESLKQAAEGVGGKVGGAAGMVEKFGRSVFEMGAALGPVGAAAVAVSVGVAAMTAGIGLAAVGIVKLVSAADEWLTSLDEMLGVHVFEDQRSQINDAAMAADGASAALKMLGVRLAIEVAPAAETLAVAATKMIVVFTDNLPLVIDLVGEFSYQLANSMASASIGTKAMWEFAEALKGVADASGLTSTASLTAWTAREKEALGIDAMIRSVKESEAEEQKAAEAKRASAEASREAADRARKLEAATRDAARAEAEHRRAIEEKGRAWLKARQEAEQFTAGIKAIADAEAAASATAQGIGSAARESQLSDLDKINSAYDAQIAKLAELSAAGASLASVSEATAALQIKHETDLAALRQASADAEKQAAQDRLDAIAEEVSSGLTAIGTLSAAANNVIQFFGDRRIEDLRNQAEAEKRAALASAGAWADAEAEKVADRLATGEINQNQADKELALIERHRKAEAKSIKRRKSDELKAARKNFKFQKAAAKAQAIIAAAQAAVQMIPSFAFLGPGAPVGAAAAAAAALTVQMAQINAQKPPSFASGGVVGDRMQADHGLIAAAPSEGIVSPRGMGAIGRDGLDQINGGQSLSTSVSVMIDRRVIASTVVDALTTDPQVGASLSALSGIPTGRALVYGRG